MDPGRGNEGGARSIAAYTNFGGDTAGPLTPPTLPFGFGRDAFGRTSPSPAAAPGPAPGAAFGASEQQHLSQASRFPPVKNRVPRSPGDYTERMNPPLRAPSSRMPLPKSPGIGMAGSNVPRAPQRMLAPSIAGTALKQQPGTAPSPRPPIMPVTRAPAPFQQQQPQGLFGGIVREPQTTKRLASVASSTETRSKSPPRSPLLSAEEQQKEDEARARRLERFKPVPGLEETSVRTEAAKKTRQPPAQVSGPIRSPEGTSMEFDDDFMTAEPVFGLCPDMCPESERSERERKGDLDRYERLDGDRNQTSINLAVKKYTRTPEKEPILIRPLPVLKSTMDYLLGLLDKPYNDDLLSLYNFLWDRMRAVRMDLRMQHIFNYDAVVMHEQMIRLHILVMHELCEYPKGEGFVEGFDAHLNIEQMNKAFSELFQMYDDHRRRGIPLSTEPEFRGYYTLLKLDQHPGFAVEPSDLSVDLAFMTPSMRNSPDLVFARKVARTYRLPDYVAFFRLAGKATYLQACLMHAQFSKVRTQALASLHSGLRIYQGIPLSQLPAWLGMERQEIEDLLSYHGFSVKLFEEPYAVKESDFLNKDEDYPTRRSRLVESKRSLRIVNDVVSPNTEVAQVDWLAEVTGNSAAPDVITEKVPVVANKETITEIVEEEMPDYEDWETPSPEQVPQVIDTGSTPSQGLQSWFPAPVVREPDEKEDVVSIDNWTFPPVPIVEEKNVQEKTSTGKRARPFDSEEQELMEQSPKRQELSSSGEVASAETAKALELERQERARLEEEQMKVEEANAGRAKLWFRRWKRRTDEKVEAARVRRMEAQVALSSMSLGLPIQDERKMPISNDAHRKIDLNYVRAHRMFLLDNLWTRLDVSSLVAPILKVKNPLATTICWKLIFCAESHETKPRLVRQWLKSKLLGALDNTSQADTYISNNAADGVDCYCICKELDFNSSFGSSIYGTSGILFLVGEDIPLSRTRNRLHSLVDALPARTCVPLVIFTSFQESNQSGIGKRPPPEEELALLLQLHRLDGNKISSWIVLSVTGRYSSRGFYCSETLAKGIEWLATLAPNQSELYAADLRDLVSERLHSALKSAALSSPDSYITAFNQALHDSAAEMYKAAMNSPSHWPPPELASVPEVLLKDTFPYPGWNDLASLQPVLQALKLCTLPGFPPLDEATSTVALSPGVTSDMLLGSVRAEYKSVLGGLQNYLTSFGDDPFEARRAAELVLNAAVGLNWSEEGCRIGVNWSRVFQSIFRTRLMSLNSEPPPTVYISRRLKQGDYSEARDYETRLALASQLRTDVPDRIKEDIANFVDSYNRQYSNELKALEEEVGTPGKEPDELDTAIRHELHHIRSGEQNKLLEMVSPVREEPLLPPTEGEVQLIRLLAKLHKRLDENTDAALAGLEDGIEFNMRIDREFEDLTPGLPTTSFVNAELSPSSTTSSSGDSYKRFSELLNSCQRAQLSISGKLGQYFGLRTSSHC